MYRGVFYVDESAGVDYAALKKARLPRTTRQDQRAYAIGGEHMTLDDIVSEPVIVRVAADPEQVALVPIAQSRLNPTSAASPTRNSVCTTGRPISARPSSAPAGARRSAGQRHTGQRPFDRRRGNQSDPKPASRQAGNSLYPIPAYFNIDIGFNNWVKGYSDEYLYAVEVGYTIKNKRTAILHLRGLESLGNGNDAEHGGLDERTEISLSAMGTARLHNALAAPVFSLDFFLKR
jgi:hypothetical protein